MQGLLLFSQQIYDNFINVAKNYTKGEVFPYYIYQELKLMYPK